MELGGLGLVKAINPNRSGGFHDFVGGDSLELNVHNPAADGVKGNVLDDGEVGLAIQHQLNRGVIAGGEQDFLGGVVVRGGQERGLIAINNRRNLASGTQGPQFLTLDGARGQR